MAPIKLGILEFGYRESQYSSVGKLVEVADYAVLADNLGFSRFWLGEHHNYYHLSAWSNPQMLIPILLNQTERINVGIAGILINYYSPYEIAMNFKLLANLYPDRVDLGFANGTPSLKVAQLLSQRDFKNYPDDHLSKISLLSSMFYQEEAFNVSEKILIPPYKGAVPALFALSSSFTKFDFCIKNRLNYAHSIFHTGEALKRISKDAIDEYKGRYYDEHKVYPSFVITFMGSCGTSKESAQNRMDNFRQSIYGWTFVHNFIIGTPDHFWEELSTYQEMFDVDEFVFCDSNIDSELKNETLYLLSEKFKLNIR